MQRVEVVCQSVDRVGKVAGAPRFRQTARLVRPDHLVGNENVPDVSGDELLRLGKLRAGNAGTTARGELPAGKLHTLV